MYIPKFTRLWDLFNRPLLKNLHPVNTNEKCPHKKIIQHDHCQTVTS